jgi:amino acid adenylation domain-containing protein
VSSLLHERVAAVADRQPDATAVGVPGRNLSYGELHELTLRVAAQLRAHRCRPGDRICLFLPKRPETIAAMLGVLEAGCVYVPIDLASPAARVAHVVRRTEPTLVLACADSIRLVDELISLGAIDVQIPLGTIDDLPMASELASTAFTLADDPGPPAPGPRRRDPGDPAHILFTSGSTGVPKGVVITHANVTAFLDWALPYFGLGPDDRISGHPPLHFDLSTFDIYGALTSGAALRLVPNELNIVPAALATFVDQERLTQWFSVPSAMTYLAMADAIPQDGFPLLRRVIWCGEVLPTPVLIHWMNRLPDATFTNLYGPTEATIASSYYRVATTPSDPAQPIPIGHACAGEELLVLDEHLSRVPDGEIGDLYIAGEGLSPGYWQDEAATAQAFTETARVAGGRRIYRTGDLAKMEDGLTWFFGRRDSQIKSRGYRIELGEIEAALGALPGISECAVVGITTDGFEGVSICCAYASRADVKPSANELRRALRKALPAYMLPAHWLVLPELPKNPNAKIDRPAIRRLFEAELEGGSSTTATTWGKAG